jgi:glycerol-3-phosphate acyltransferase PlsX
MPDKVRIALDAMGGDHGPSVVLPAADLSLTRHPDIEYLLFGDRAVLEPLLEGLPRLKAKARVVHTDVAIRMDDKPSQALRYGRWKSSMWLAIDAVKKHEADAVVSAGNTGALMAMARFNLKMV